MSAMSTFSEFRAFPKTWGCEFVAAGEAAFRLWAPGQEALYLRLNDRETPMTRSDDGWFELLAAGIEPGTEYAYVLPSGMALPDPASRGQKESVTGPSLVIDPTSYQWRNLDWQGRPWEEAVIYELHVGTFTPEGTFRAAIERLSHLAALGITAIEVMPIGHFAGARGWGYDGALIYAPHAAYGAPEDFKAFVDAAHGHGLMVLLDVVHNHFGPEGNFLPLLAPDFFHPEKHTPWGAAIAYENDPVRRFFVENALYWLEEFHLDGLRFDAIDQIEDPSEKHIMVEIAEHIRAEFGDRHIHLATEDSRNLTFLHERDEQGRVKLFTGEWNDDFHNAMHVLATGETDGYYRDFADSPEKLAARALAEGFAYQGEVTVRTGKPRGVPSAAQPPTTFVDFIQNHDQVGNRAHGERLLSLAGKDKVKALTTALLLSPHIPLMFMGEEYGETTPFLFFTDFHGNLAKAVREGRQKEFEGHNGHGEETVPDPNAKRTFLDSRLDWSKAENDEGREWLKFTRELLSARRRFILPLIGSTAGNSGRILATSSRFIAVSWSFPAGRLHMAVNLGEEARSAPGLKGQLIWGEPVDGGAVPPKAVLVRLEAAGDGQ